MWSVADYIGISNPHRNVIQLKQPSFFFFLFYFDSAKLIVVIVIVVVVVVVEDDDDTPQLAALSIPFPPSPLDKSIKIPHKMLLMLLMLIEHCLCGGAPPKKKKIKLFPWQVWHITKLFEMFLLLLLLRAAVLIAIAINALRRQVN